jgi:hypothetical protein
MFRNRKTRITAIYPQLKEEKTQFITWHKYSIKTEFAGLQCLLTLTDRHVLLTTSWIHNSVSEEISSLQSAVYSSGEPKLTFILLRNSRFVSEVSKSTKQSPKS